MGSSQSTVHVRPTKNKGYTVKISQHVQVQKWHLERSTTSVSRDKREKSRKLSLSNFQGVQPIVGENEQK